MRSAPKTAWSNSSTFDAKEGSPYITKTSAGSLLQDDGMIGRKTMQSLIRYAESALMMVLNIAQHRKRHICRPWNDCLR